MTEKDTYKTIAEPSPESLYKEKGSKFLGYAFPVTDEEEIKEHLERLKKQHHNARHWCYAWQLGKNYDSYRANDDGEPSNSAGMPIYGQIQSFELTNILVVVVRYFGGTKLGVSGLVQAYKTAAQLALESAKIVEHTIDKYLKITFEYPEMNTVMRIIKEEDLHIVHQNMHLSCEIVLAVRKKEFERIFEIFQSLFKINVKKVENPSGD
ncbi:MAG: YigZ family protein [Bacteroidetes bacterium]|nr:YigZ family protein [Bacteroidota bacterium]